MSIIPSFASLLMQESHRESFRGSFLLLGKTDICMDKDELDSIASRNRYHLQIPRKFEIVDSQFSRGRKVVSDRHFFESLGAGEVLSLDASGFEGADFVFDLNSEMVPVEFENRFDVIINPGTLEHVFHLPNALRNIHAMLKTNGRVIHSLPTSNNVEHGFFMFSPCFVRDFYGQNGYEIIAVKLVRYKLETILDFVEVRDFKPEEGWGDITGQLSDHVYSVYAVVQKKENATGDKIPQQGYYQKTWTKQNSETEPQSSVDRSSSEIKLSPVRLIVRIAYRCMIKAPFFGNQIEKSVKRQLFLMKQKKITWTKV
jgi:SAM-dependent methyltransferase